MNTQAAARNPKPRIVITLGDVAGVGPEVMLRAWRNPALHAACRLLVVGDVAQLERQRKHFGLPGRVVEVRQPEAADSSPDCMPCLQGTETDLQEVRFGAVRAEAGRAAYDFLCRAIDLVQTGRADAVVTAPLHKEGLRAAGLPYPGHTEILAERCRTSRYGMMLFASRRPDPGLSFSSSLADSWGVAHVTLHAALRNVFEQLYPGAVLEKIRLADEALRGPLGRRPRIGVCGLNPHAGDGGLFGSEEHEVIAPAVQEARQLGVDASGPWPSDNLFVRAYAGEFDAVIAMYHDQGHIPFKLLAGRRAVNITLGLPMVRTSVAHGTAYDIAGQGKADPTSMLEAIRVARSLALARPEAP